MMKRVKKILLFLLVFPVIFNSCNCLSVEKVSEFEFKGNVEILLNRTVYNAGDIFESTIKVFYLDNYTVPDAYLVINIVKEGKIGYTYPSQNSDDNIVYEKIITLNLSPYKRIYVYNFTWSIPKDIESGKYRIDVYLHTARIPIVGIPFIFLNPISKEFEIIGRRHGFPYFEIVRNETNVNKIVGPIGGLVNKSYLGFQIVVKSKMNSSAKVLITISPWNDISDHGVKFIKYVDLHKGKNIINLTINNPYTKPYAYSVRVEVLDNKNRVNSLYRLRYIIPGSTAVLRGLFTDDSILDNKTNVFVLVGPSPDHYTYPTIYNVSLYLTVKDYNNNIVYNKKIYEFTKLSSRNVSLFLITKNIPVLYPLNVFTLCAELYDKNNNLLDKMCKTFNYKNIEIPIERFVIQVINETIVVYPLSLFGRVVNNAKYELIIAKENPQNVIFSASISGIFQKIVNESGKYIITVIYEGKSFSKTLNITISKPVYGISVTKTEKTKKERHLSLVTKILLILLIIFLIMVGILFKKEKRITMFLLFCMVLIFFVNLRFVYPSCSPWVFSHYDSNKDYVISDNELLNAVQDWFNNNITDSQLTEVISCWITTTGAPSLTLQRKMWLCDKYDSNFDNSLNDNELINSLRDWLDNKISNSDLLYLIVVWLGNDQCVHWSPAYGYITISPNTLCSPSGKVSINAYYERTPYTVKVYVDGSEVLSRNCATTSCTFSVRVSGSPGTSHTVEAKIVEIGHTAYDTSSTVNFIYPYSFSLADTSVYKGALVGLILTKNCNYVPDTTFSIYIGNTLVRSDCTYSGDEDWEGNTCGIPTSSVSSGTYTVKVSYSINGNSFSQSAGTLTINPPPSGFSSENYCRHGWGFSNNEVFSYTKEFDGEWTTDNNVYVLAKGASLKIKDISSYILTCSNGVTRTKLPTISSWISRYGTFIDYSDNTNYQKIGYSYSNFKSKIYSQAYVGRGVVGSTSSYTVYTFDKPGKYTVNIAVLKAQCDSPKVYVCPATTSGNPCYVGYLRYNGRYIGFKEKEEISILVPDPSVEVSTYNYTNIVFTEKKNKKFLLAYVKNTGIGKVKVTLKPIVKFENGTTKNLQTLDLILDEGKDAYIYYDVPWDLCLHTNCTINYYIYYDDGYGFNTYSESLAGYGYIEIIWNSLELSVVKTTIYEGKWNDVKIRVTNLGPATAKEIRIQKITYNSNCLDIKDNNDILKLDNGESGYLSFKLKVKDLKCNSNDYKVSLEVYGWNTYIYTLSFYVPVSLITSPSQDSLLGKTSSLSITDKNANTCYIEVNRNINKSRTCSSVYNNIYYDCEKNDEPDCYIKVLSENQHFKFISKSYHYRTEAYLSISHKKATLKDRQKTTFYITVYNLPDPNVKAKNVKIISLLYNSSCVQITNKGDNLNLNVDNTGDLRIDVRIKNYGCNPSEYNITVKIQGYNTVVYTYTIAVPLSYIISPVNGSILLNPTLIQIVDKNVDECKISIDGKVYNRSCYNHYIYNAQCINKTCVIYLISSNDYFTYISDSKVYTLPTGQAGYLAVFTSSSFELRNKPETLRITVVNTANKTVCYTLSLNTSKCASVKSIYVNGRRLYSFGTTINILPSASDIWEIELQPVKYCVAPMTLDVKTCPPNSQELKKTIMLYVLPQNVTKESLASTLSASESPIPLLVTLLPFLFVFILP